MTLSESETAALLKAVDLYTFFFIILIALCFFALIFVLIMLARNIKARQQLKENTQFIGEVVSVQENERKRISQELHDTVSQNIKVLLMWEKKLLEEKMSGSSPNMTKILTPNMTKISTPNMTKILTPNMTKMPTPTMTKISGQSMTKTVIEPVEITNSDKGGFDKLNHHSESNRQLEKIISLEKQNQKELRAIIQNLAIPELENVPFKTLIESLCEEFQNQSGIKCTFFVSENIDLEKFSSDERHHILRIIQEALNNAKTHANPSETSVIFQKKQNKIILMIFDDGEGFDESKSKNDGEKHFGMSGMEMRAKLLGGKFMVKSDKETGTQIHLEIEERQAPAQNAKLNFRKPVNIQPS